MLQSNTINLSDFQKVQELLVRLSNAEYKIYMQEIEIKYLQMQLHLANKFAEIEAKYLLK